MDEYLEDLRRELGDLGPLERNRVVHEVRSDISELAERKQSGPTDSDSIQAAIREMPPAFEVAQEYLRTHGPPLFMTRLAIGLNLVVGIVAFLVAFVGILSTVTASPRWASNVVMIMVGVTLFVASCSAIAAYGIALISPRRATRWRFGILPAAWISLLADVVLIAVVSAFDWRIAMTLLTGMLLGGTYVISYTHRQFARLDVQDLYSSESGDYLRAIAKGVRDLDGIRRREVLVELRSHVEASGIDISRLEPDARRAKLEELLGAPTEVATAYMDRFGGPLPRKWARGLIGVLLIAAVGFVVGSIVLATGLDISVREGGYLTVLGLASSVGILGLSAILLWMAMRVYRAPAQRTDHGRPFAVAVTAAALLLSIAILGAPGALVVQGDFVRHEILGSVRLEDGSLGVLWYSYLANNPWRVIDESEPRSPLLGAWVTVVDRNGVVGSTESFPARLPTGPLLDLARSNGSWIALFPDSLIMWGASNASVPLAGPAWDEADGHIEGSVARIAWIRYSGFTLQVAFERIDLVTPSSGVRWQRTVSLANATNTEVRVSSAAVLVAASVSEENSTHAHAMVSVNLIPEAGTTGTSFLLHERTVQLAGPGDATNGTWINLEDIQATDHRFWLSGPAWTEANGTEIDSTWAAQVDVASATATEWDLHQVSFPEPSGPPAVGDQDAVIYRGSIANEDRLFVASSSYRVIFSAEGDWQPDEATSTLLLSSLLPTGAVEYTVQLNEGIQMRSPLFPIVGISQGRPTVLAFPLDRFMVSSIGPVMPPPAAVQSESIALRLGEYALLYRVIATSPEGVFSFDPSMVGYLGEGFVQDSGFLGWRDSSPSPVQAFLSVPAILLVDFATGSTRLVPFVAPHSRPDMLLDLVLSSSFTVVMALLLVVGYPRWHMVSRRRKPVSRGASTERMRGVIRSRRRP